MQQNFKCRSEQSSTVEGCPEYRRGSVKRQRRLYGCNNVSPLENHVLRSPSPFLHYSQGVYIDRLRRSSQSRCRPARPVLGARQRCRAIIEDNLQQYGPLKLQVRDAEILALLVPALGSVFLDPAMQVIDTAIVGSLGPAPLGALGLSNLIYFFCTVFFSFLLVVTTPKVANAVAVGDRDQASSETANAIWVGVGCGVLLGVALWYGAPWLVMKGFAAGPQVAELAVQHLKIRALATPAVVVLFVVNGAFRGFKDTKTPLLAGIAQNGVNLILDILLVYYLGWGVKGAATAITFAQYVGVLAMLSILSRKAMMQFSDLSKLPSPSESFGMLKTGIPLAFCIASVMTTVVSATNLAAGLGTVALAAHTVIKQITDFCLGLLGTFSTVSQTLIASCMGENDKKKARSFVARLLQFGIGFGILLAVVVFFGAAKLPALFSTDKEVIGMAQRVIPLVALALPLAPCQTTLEGVMLGSFKVVWVGGRTVLGALFALFVLNFTKGLGMGLTGIWLGLMSLIACNFVADAIRITRQDSPIAAVLENNLTFSFDEEAEEEEEEARQKIS